VFSESGAMRPRTHMLLLVELPAGQFVVDVGFGGDGLLHPIALQHDASVRAGMSHHRLRSDGPQWVLQVEHDGQWTDLYHFDLAPQWPADYEVANHFTSTHPSSPFVANLTAQLVRRQRHVVLRNRTLTVREPGGSTTQTVRDPTHLLAVLEGEFRLAFPPGTRFRRPEF
jgi:N-hydroxyarylamine O-acetyltransferase